jgi:tetratricopeptide (TPR) repeat protein
MIGQEPRFWLENAMRLFPIVLALGLAASTASIAVQGQAPDDQLNPRSVALLKQGEAALAAGKFSEADDAFETALAVDPRNRAAFIALGRTAQRQKLFGQAIRFYNKALALEPNDLDALTAQGTAMVELGALSRAKENLTKVQKICANSCTQATTLAAAIARGPTVAAIKPPPTPKTN